MHSSAGNAALISLSATNPCHLYDLATALHALSRLSRYYSGYPGWRLHPPAAFPLHVHSGRTLVTYGLLRLSPAIRPSSPRLFRWQDAGFDRAVAHDLTSDGAAMLHALPGQAQATFTAARARGTKTVLNHASGPVRQQLELTAEEYSRVGLDHRDYHTFDASYFRQEEQEYALADWHCVASSVVRQQLVQCGVSPTRIWTVPYAAAPHLFHPPRTRENRDEHQIVFAGQYTLRKGLRIAFSAIEEVRATHPVTFALYGRRSPEAESTLARVASKPWVRLNGPLPQPRLAEVFRHAGMLVLPSWEEAFGLVVVQALACGLPCIVSDRVGASDLIIHRQNGSIFPAGDAAAMALEIAWWIENRRRFQTPPHTWASSAERLVTLTEAALKTPSP
ncbi:glycosyltransferase family 4 protein [Opitutus sp. ER46]|uniref:glycosyltransferase family 4 protein n=1 Tax=Opitutus sp. ER46 TaxID=2161864 RepID=UPI001304952C|nr:glycosyltransferase family 4 protein [Opitutus sp. ER46]